MITQHSEERGRHLKEASGGVPIKIEGNYDNKGKPLFQQIMWNKRVAVILVFILFFQAFLYSIGVIRLAIREESYQWFAGGLFLMSLSLIGMISTPFVYKFTRIQIYENGIVIPKSLRSDIRHSRKYNTLGIFYPFDDIIDIYGEGKYFMFIKTNEVKTGGYFFKTKNRNKLLSIALEAQKKYNEKKDILSSV